MKSTEECLKCIDRLGQRMLNLVPDKNNEQISSKIRDYLSKVDMNLTPMHISQGVFQIVQTETGINDPYIQIKKKANENALKLVNEVNKAIKASDDPVYSAIKASIAGNIIDYGISDDYNLEKTLNEVLKKEPAVNDYFQLKKEVEKTSSLTSLADNAGEIVFDKILLDVLTTHYSFDKIRLIVKKHPFINDVTKNDIKELGFEKINQLEVIEIDNHSPSSYQQQMIDQVNKSDLTISKGQGNLEMIYDLSPGAYFLFIVKCQLIGEEVGVKEGEIMITYS